MSKPTRDPDGGVDRDIDTGRGWTKGTPRWVKAFAVVGLVVALLLVIVAPLPGRHGPGRHLPSDSGGNLLPLHVVQTT